MLVSSTVVWHQCHTRVWEFIQIHVCERRYLNRNLEINVSSLFKARVCVCARALSRMNRVESLETSKLKRVFWERTMTRSSNDISNAVFPSIPPDFPPVTIACDRMCDQPSSRLLRDIIIYGLIYGVFFREKTNFCCEF